MLSLPNWYNKYLNRYVLLIGFMGFSLCSCNFLLDRDGVEVKVSSLPYGQSSLKAGKIITFAGDPKTANKTRKIKFNNFSPEQTSKSTTEIVVATFDNQIRLIDFISSDINPTPDLNFKSTARSLVFMNPLFLGLSFETRKNILPLIEKDQDFLKLVDLISQSLSLFDDKIVDLSAQIAIRVAETQGIIIYKEQSQKQESHISTQRESVLPNNVDSNPLTKETFPKKSCGDSFPTAIEDFPVSFYPVFVDYTAANLQKIKLNFCEDAYKLIREETGKESIQIGSFTNLERAKAFEKLMLNELGSGEIGKAKIFEKPRSQFLNDSLINLFSSIYHKGINSLIPGANAQAPIESTWLEYSLLNQFTNDGLFYGTNWPLWHGLELKVDSNGIKITGTPLIAQQVIVLPENATNRSTDAIVNEIIYPANLGTWDGNTIKTLSGENKIEEIYLKPESGTWQPGNYDVLISGGSILRSTQVLPAFTINMFLFINDFLALIKGNADSDSATTLQKIKSIAINSAAITLDCVPEINQKLSQAQDKTDKPDKPDKPGQPGKPDILSVFGYTTQCLAKPSNLKIITEMFGISDEKIISQILAQLIKFEGKAWEKTLNNISKKGEAAISIVDKIVSLSRIFIFGKYLEHENTKKTFYFASFSVKEITEQYPSRTKTTPFASRTIELDCSPNNPGSRKYQELDVIIEVSCQFTLKGGISRIKATNYSNNAVEVSLPIPGSRSDLLLPNESETYGAGIPWDLRDNWKNRPEEGIKTSGLDYFDFIERFLPYKLSLSLTSYSSRQLIKEVRVKCSDSPTTLWGVKITPQCVPPGLRATYKNITYNRISVGLVGLNQPPIYLKPLEEWERMYVGEGFEGTTGGSGNVSSTQDNVTLTIILNY
ncbi:MAG TPA: hypothetical protein IGS52_15660 [Oscillatoriaceae cyanobacterium M33_DOE_052]|uniref:Uncharacterized protein n=1 Tax=Planktothricoides sp. SpSt-374 TaxID=2282167 RepID=A0A7C3VEM5_9CYAN|nr:hypothetical protein [Oscillatoriaceae cyanobacterium M33_DOE_052]